MFPLILLVLFAPRCGPCPLILVDGSWTTWTAWSKCSVTCGSGTHTRNRTCVFPVGVPHGNTCVGESTEFGSCAQGNCPGKWCGIWLRKLNFMLVMILLEYYFSNVFMHKHIFALIHSSAYLPLNKYLSDGFKNTRITLCTILCWNHKTPFSHLSTQCTWLFI